MRAKRRIGTVGKAIGCAVLLVIALFPIYWLLAMAIRPTDEMKGQISLIPQTLTLSACLPTRGSGRPPSTACRPP